MRQPWRTRTKGSVKQKGKKFKAGSGKVRGRKKSKRYKPNIKFEKQIKEYKKQGVIREVKPSEIKIPSDYNYVTHQNLAGVKNAVTVYSRYQSDVNIIVKVKELTKKQILKLASEWDCIPPNATPFYHSKGNTKRLFELVEEGKLVRRDSEGLAFELPKKEVKPPLVSESSSKPSFGIVEKQVFSGDSKYAKKWDVPSHSKENQSYTVSQRHDGQYECSCWKWIRTRSDCKHIDDVKDMIGGS